jgi:integrase
MPLEGHDGSDLVTTPKGRMRRSVPMTAPRYDALKRMQTIREGLVLRRLDGSPKTDDDVDAAIRRICRRAGQPVRYFHVLRHVGTHAALFGVNRGDCRRGSGTSGSTR